jgi:hypothetical protein
LSKTLDDSKLANILYEAANKEQAWLDEKFEEAKASEIALHRRTLNVRMAGKNPNPFRG